MCNETKIKELYKSCRTLTADQAAICFTAAVQKAAIEQKCESVILQFYCTCADAYNKRAYNKTKVCFILLSF